MALLNAERTTYADRNPRSHAAGLTSANLFGRVPMTWMAKNAGGFPLYLDGAWGPG